MNSKTICVNGELGSGKSVVSRQVAERINATYISMGEIQRGLAAKLGMTTLDFNRQAEIDPAIDAILDKEFSVLVQSNNSIVIDSRIGWLRLPASFKVRLTCDPLTAAKRIFADRSRTAESYLDIDDAVKQINARQQSEVRRYKERYHVDITDEKNYNLWIKTDDMSVDDVSNKIIAALKTTEL